MEKKHDVEASCWRCWYVSGLLNLFAISLLVAMASNPEATAPNLVAMAPDLIAMASNPIDKALFVCGLPSFNLRGGP